MTAPQVLAQIEPVRSGMNVQCRRPVAGRMPGQAGGPGGLGGGSQADFDASST